MKRVLKIFDVNRKLDEKPDGPLTDEHKAMLVNLFNAFPYLKTDSWTTRPDRCHITANRLWIEACVNFQANRRWADWPACWIEVQTFENIKITEFTAVRICSIFNIDNICLQAGGPDIIEIVDCGHDKSKNDAIFLRLFDIKNRKKRLARRRKAIEERANAENNKTDDAVPSMSSGAGRSTRMFSSKGEALRARRMGINCADDYDDSTDDEDSSDESEEDTFSDIEDEALAEALRELAAQQKEQTEWPPRPQENKEEIRLARKKDSHEKLLKVIKENVIKDQEIREKEMREREAAAAANLNGMKKKKKKSKKKGKNFKEKMKEAEQKRAEMLAARAKARAARAERKLLQENALAANADADKKDVDAKGADKKLIDQAVVDSTAVVQPMPEIVQLKPGTGAVKKQPLQAHRKNRVINKAVQTEPLNLEMKNQERNKSQSF